MNFFNVMVHLYCRRNKVAAAACSTWPENNILTFRNSQINTAKLNDLVDQNVLCRILSWRNIKRGSIKTTGRSAGLNFPN